LIDDGYRSITLPFREIAVPDLEMSERWTLEQVVGYIRTWSATSRYREVMNADPTVTLRAGLLEAWPNPEVPRRVWWPLYFKVGRSHD
jgi:hypothetical protein